jgi:AcrR family transcriptional regulator
MTLPTDQAGLAGGAAQPASWQNELVTAQAGRPYAGISQPERQARRREQLLEAGLEVFGTTGYAASSVREVCEVAELNRRYFYESFRTREDLLRAVYEQIICDSREAVVAALADTSGTVDDSIRAGLTAWWETITSDPRKARIITLEIVGVSEAIETRRREVRRGFADFLAAQAVALASTEMRELRIEPIILARSLVAAIVDLVVDVTRGDTDSSTETMVETCFQLVSVAFDASFERDVERDHRVRPA